MAAIALVALGILLVNLPFGCWRSSVRRLSLPWFVAVHAPVPLAVGLRYVTGVGFRWATLPLLVAAYLGGQYLGGRLGRRLAAARSAG